MSPYILYFSQLDNHEAESICIANSLGFNDYLIKSNSLQHANSFDNTLVIPTQYQKLKKENGDRLARSQKICVNEENKIFKNVRTTSTYGATDKFGHTFPWVKSDKKWRQTIRTAKIVLDTNVKLVTSDIEQFF